MKGTNLENLDYISYTDDNFYQKWCFFWFMWSLKNQWCMAIDGIVFLLTSDLIVYMILDLHLRSHISCTFVPCSCACFNGVCEMKGLFLLLRDNQMLKFIAILVEYSRSRWGHFKWWEKYQEFPWVHITWLSQGKQKKTPSSLACFSPNHLFNQ